MPPATAVGKRYDFEGQRYVVVEDTPDMCGMIRAINADGDECWLQTNEAVLVDTEADAAKHATTVATVQTNSEKAHADTEVQYNLPGLRTDSSAEILPLHRLLLAL